MLRRPKDGKDFRDMGNWWAKENERGSSDRRPLDEVGIEPGQLLEVVRPESPHSRVKQ
jgi:hypothetical protein